MRNITKILTLLVVCLIGMQANAQNVTIGPDNGSLISGIGGGNTGDSGKGRGMASMWRHEQLPLTMTTSDIANLTSAGELADPSCAIGKYDADGDGHKELFIGAGQTQTFIVVSLPKGYRIRGYRLVLQPNMYGNNITINQGYNSWDLGTDDLMRFYETEPWSIGYPYTSATTGNNSNTHCTLYDLDQYGYSYNAVAHLIDSEVTTANTLMQNNNATNRSKQYVIERYSKNETDMTNQLHFVIVRGASQYALTIRSFDILFTAEGTFTADITPAALGEATDYVTSPFSTSKMDVGSVKLTDGLYSYDFTGVQDLIAYTHLYQDNAVAGGKPSHVDGPKNIYPVQIDGQGAYVFGNDMYYLEPPTTIHTASGWESPIGFRVIGATFNYQWSDQDIAGQTIRIPNSCTIRGTYPNNQGGNGGTGYLNDLLDFSNTTFSWSIDDYNNIYREYTVTTDGTNTTYRKYLACFGSGDEREVSLSSSATGDEARFNLKIDSQGRVYYLSDGGNYYYLNWRIRQEGSTYHSRGFVRKEGSTGWNSNLASATTSGSHTITTPAVSPGSYTLKVYGTEKSLTADPVYTVTVDENTPNGTYHLTGLNNDAVRFEIADLASGKTALLHVKLELQALNPYINSMDVVCEDTPKELQLTQTFNSNDFRVSGGKFIFYIPEEYQDSLLTISFKNLYSDYGDETYYGGPGKGNSRYSFVTSPYFIETTDLYAEDYDPNETYADKVHTDVAGNIRFKFNNAEDLTSGSTASNLIEFPFSYSGYIGSSNPDAQNGLPTGNYIDCRLKASDPVQKAGTFYVFTADETRYNIAPTTAWQHRSYAFYRMDIELEAKEYVPELTWDKIYDKTCYYSGEDNFPENDRGDAPAGSALTNSMWGVKVTTSETIDNKYGYLTYHAIIKKIESVLDATNTNAPASMDQILYVDGSLLHSLVNSKVTETVDGTTKQVDYTLQTLKDAIGKNALAFLPASTTSTLDNVAYISNGAFRAGKDIVLTDRYPFYSPYDIQVISPNQTTYTRVITLPDYGQDVLASVMLPFTLDVVDGKHTNPANGIGANSSYTLWEMGSADMTLEMKEANHDYGVGYFKKVNVAYTSANVPYMVNLDKQAVQGTDYSFVAAQTGGKIFATTGMQKRTAGGGTYKYLFNGTAVSGFASDVPGGSLTLTPEGSYSGEIYDRAHSNAIFYFANNKFLNLYKLMATKRYLYMYPFRGVYTFDGTYAPNSVKSMNGLNISFEDPLGLDGIRDMATANTPDLAVRSGKGFIQVTSAKAQMVNILSLNGTTYSRVMLNSGDSKTVTLPAGVYVVNNVKIIVK